MRLIFRKGFTTELTDSPQRAVGLISEGYMLVDVLEDINQVKSVAKEPESTEVSCPYCKKTYSGSSAKGNLTKHIKDKHPQM